MAAGMGTEVHGFWGRVERESPVIPDSELSLEASDLFSETGSLKKSLAFWQVQGSGAPGKALPTCFSGRLPPSPSLLPQMPWAQSILRDALWPPLPLPASIMVGQGGGAGVVLAPPGGPHPPDSGVLGLF